MDNSSNQKQKKQTADISEKTNDFLMLVTSHIFCAGIVILALILLSGCSHKQGLNKNIDSLPVVDTSVPEPFLERFKPTGMSLGGWLELEEKGSYFKPVKRQNPESALIYFYRPDSSWSQQEIVAATILLNGKKLNSLMNNHYYPIELPAGSYRLAIRRPIPTPPTSFQKGTVVDFKVEAGKTYYLKYAEQYHIVPPKKSLGLLYKRPIIQMPDIDGLKEIGSTRLKTYGYIFTDNPNQVATSLPGFNGKRLEAVKSSSLSEQNSNQAKQKFSYINPLTW